jgi:hypothetical protein
MMVCGSPKRIKCTLKKKRRTKKKKKEKQLGWRNGMSRRRTNDDGMNMMM